MPVKTFGKIIFLEVDTGEVLSGEKLVLLNDKDREDAFFESKKDILESLSREEAAFEDIFFEKLMLLSGAGKNSFSHLKFGVAVSGGADSICLLTCLASICRKYSMPLRVCTVNHRIRTNGDSEEDARFVERFCAKLKSLGSDIELFTKNLEEGQVESLSRERKGGEEEAARFLRYQAFEEFQRLYELDYVLLAHNGDDNLETILMRFLQGTFSSGIRPARDFYLRPLIFAGRDEIETYLNLKAVPWRTDSTNFNLDYYRNRVRKSLVPFLNENFDGWKQSLLNGAERYRKTEDFLEKSFEQAKKKLVRPFYAKEEEKRDVPLCSDGNIPPFSHYSVNKSDFISYDRKSLSSFDDALLSRLFYDMFNQLGLSVRVPYRRIQEVLDAMKKRQTFEIALKEVSFGFDLSSVYVKKPENLATESYFFAIIEKKGEYLFPFGKLEVQEGESEAFVNLKSPSFFLEKVKCPFVIRSVRNSDLLKTSDGRERRAKSILSSWHIPPEKRSLVPVIMEYDEMSWQIKALLGSVVNCKNWIVQK